MSNEKTTEPAGDAEDGRELVLASLCAPYGDRLATYDAAGQAVIWQVPADLADIVGTGALPRREAGEGATAECILVDPNQMLMLVDGKHTWPVSLPSEPASTDWEAVRARLRDLLLAGARRGESVSFARAGSMELGMPAVRFTVMHDESGDWISVVEAFPPVAEGIWAVAAQDEERSAMSAPAGVEQVDGAAELMLAAASGWTGGPELIGVFFSAAPDGAWPG